MSRSEVKAYVILKKLIAFADRRRMVYPINRFGRTVAAPAPAARTCLTFIRSLVRLSILLWTIGNLKRSPLFNML